MLLIPEIQTVVIFPPRTGSGSLRRALQARYPQAMLLYRHMEADGVPAGYDVWPKVGVVREPVERLWSLYKFMQRQQNPTYPEWSAALRQSANWPFEDWLLGNEGVFSAGHPMGMPGVLVPGFFTRHLIPENRKSQWWYLRPDLGTTIWRFTDLAELAESLGVHLDCHNATDGTPPPPLSPRATEHIQSLFAWDIEAARAG